MAAVCALDVGTTRVKALLLTAEAVPGPVAAVPSVLATPKPGRAEVDAEALWAQVLAVLREVAAGGARIEALAIGNQRATALLVDAAGRAFGPGLSWQDQRGEDELGVWLADVGIETFTATTGLVPSTLWSLARILWWRGQGLPAGSRIATVQDWLLRRLGASDWVLDYANASLTGLMNIHHLAWDAGLVQAAGLTPSQLPRLLPSASRVGELSADVAGATGLQQGTPLILGGGDQQCAALGGGALQPGVASLNLGTAGVVSTPADRVVLDPSRRLVCLAHVVPGHWALEGLENTFGPAVAWGGEVLGHDLATLAAGAPAGSRGIIFAPYLAGSGAPDYDPAARGAFLGLSLRHRRADLARAIYEGVALELTRILNAVRELVPLQRLMVGGGAGEPLLLDLLANLAGMPLSVAPHQETSLVGAGLLGWTGLGRWADARAAAAAVALPAATVAPSPSQRGTYRALYNRYERAVEGLRRGGVLSTGEEEADG